MKYWVAIRAAVVTGAFVLAGAAFADDQAPGQPKSDEAVPSTSATPPSPQQPAQPAAEAEKNPLDEIVCKKEDPTVGSRIGSRKVCKTRRQWRDGERDATSPDLPDGSLQPPPPGGVK